MVNNGYSGIVLYDGVEVLKNSGSWGGSSFSYVSNSHSYHACHHISG